MYVSIEEIKIRSKTMNIKIFTRAIASILFRFFWIFPVKKNKIIFCSYSGKGISDNPK